MKQFFLSRVFLIGLCAYLRRLEMSIDRALRGEIRPLKAYCKGNAIPTLQQVLNRFSSIGVGVKIEKPLWNDPCIPPPGAWSVLIAWSQWYFRRGILLKESEIQRVHTSLLELSVALDQHVIVDPEVFGLLRVRLGGIVDNLLRYIPNRRIRKKIYRVEHLNQNPMTKTLTIESIFNQQDWLASRMELADD